MSPIPRPAVHVLTVLAVGALALASGRWLRNPNLLGLAALIVLIVLVTVSAQHLYGRSPAPEPAAPREEDSAPAEEPAAPLWAGSGGAGAGED